MSKEKKKKEIRLRPVICSNNMTKKHSKQTAQQMFLLKALTITKDPKKLKNMIGVGSVAAVYRTLDKLVMRKEYHAALNRAGISFDYITKGIKNIADTADKDNVRLSAFQTLLKSLGMEKYDVSSEEAGGSWEETLLKKIEEDKSNNENVNKIGESSEIPSDAEVYSVKKPEIPKSELLREEEEEEVTGTVYDTKK